jgi:hypothetical protein
MQAERKEIIRFSLDYDIEDIRTYDGYRGDLLIKITTMDKQAMMAIRRFALSLGIEEVVIKQNPSFHEYEIYCVTTQIDENELQIDDEERF